MYLERALMEELEMRKPAKSTICSANWNLVTIENYASFSNEGKEVDSSPPVILKVWVVVDSVVHTSLFPLKLQQNGIETSTVAITRW